MTRQHKKGLALSLVVFFALFIHVGLLPVVGGSPHCALLVIGRPSFR